MFCVFVIPLRLYLLAILVAKFPTKCAPGLGADTCVGGAEVASRHNLYRHIEHSYHLQTEECFPVSTLILTTSCSLPVSPVRGGGPHHARAHATTSCVNVNAPSDSVSASLLSLLCPLYCATLRLLLSFLFLRLLRPLTRILTGPSERNEIKIWILWISLHGELLWT